jgi:hypothetical protein
MKNNRMGRIVKVVVFAILVTAVLGFVVMGLWNWLMPALFGWRLITFWRAVGILLLSKILFGGLRGGPGRHMYSRWAHMTPEEREKFRAGMRGRCGSFEAAAAEPKA